MRGHFLNNLKLNKNKQLINMPLQIILSENFKREVKILGKKYPSLNNDFLSLLGELNQNPQLGTPIGQDCYKIRLHIKSKKTGKSGGGRVITCVKIVDEKVYLLSVYDKAEQENIADKRLQLILKEVGLSS